MAKRKSSIDHAHKGMDGRVDLFMDLIEHYPPEQFQLGLNLLLCVLAGRATEEVWFRSMMDVRNYMREDSDLFAAYASK